MTTLPPSLSVLCFLKARLERISCTECADATALVTEAIQKIHNHPGDAEKLTQDVCYAVWGCVSRALDVAELSEQESIELYALEAEMAGRVLYERVRQANGLK